MRPAPAVLSGTIYQAHLCAKPRCRRPVRIIRQRNGVRFDACRHFVVTLLPVLYDERGELRITLPAIPFR